MSDLIAIAYPDEATAAEVRDKLVELQRGHTIELEDIVIVTRDGDGKVKLHQATNLTAAGAAGGALWGTLIGMLFLAPLFGAVIGGAAGAAGGAVTDIRIQADLPREAGAKHPPDATAVPGLSPNVTPPNTPPQIPRGGGALRQAA